LNQASQIFLIYILCFPSFLLRAQDTAIYNNSSPDSSSLTGKYKQVDIVDFWRIIRHKEIEEEKRLDSTKHQEGKTHISIVPVIGYSLQTGFAAVLSGNVAFHTSMLERQKLSSILASLNYTQYKQFIVPLQASIWTKGNKYNFNVDWRYMKYPSTTYGLGLKTTLVDAYTIDFSYLKVHETVFRSVAPNFYAGLGYYLDYLWNIKEVNLTSADTTIFKRYDLTSKEIASGIALRLLYDSRLNQIDPINGFYANIAYRPNFTFMGSHSNWQSLLIEFRKYVKLPTRKKNVIALWSYNWLTVNGKPPYLLLPSTGWDDPFNTGRGYIQGRFRGKNMVYLEAEYRCDITRNGLLGAVVFVNSQSFSSETYKELISFVPGWGAGLRIKLNKFSGSNLCIDYGFGRAGSRGFFVNLNEVF
jgi:hypothetical protein